METSMVRFREWSLWGIGIVTFVLSVPAARSWLTALTPWLGWLMATLPVPWAALVGGGGLVGVISFRAGKKTAPRVERWFDDDLFAPQKSPAPPIVLDGLAQSMLKLLADMFPYGLPAEEVSQQLSVPESIARVAFLKLREHRLAGANARLYGCTDEGLKYAFDQGWLMKKV
jgi:hypothetical protein